MTDKMKENVEMVSNMLNSFSFNDKEFCELFCKEHRTLQQSLTRLCREWLFTCADDNYRYDDRNEASHEWAKALLSGDDADFIGLPLI